MEEDDSDRVCRARRLLERTGINPWIILQGAYKQVGHNSKHRQGPD